MLQILPLFGLVFVLMGCQQVVMTEQKLGSDSVQRTFEFKKEGCEFRWELTVSKVPGQPSGLSIRPQKKTCAYSAEEQVDFHREVLRAVVKEVDLNDVRLMTGSLSGLGFVTESIGLLSQAAARSKDWSEYRAHYPNHSSKKSSNQILVESARGTRVLRPLENLFAEHDLKVNLESVEKVFAQRPGDRGAPLMIGISRSQNVFYDAGIWHFLLKSSTSSPQ